LFAENVVGFFTIKKSLFEGNVANTLVDTEEGGGGFYLTITPEGTGATDLLIKESELRATQLSSH
jgi:hypothetical protein